MGVEEGGNRWGQVGKSFLNLGLAGFMSQIHITDFFNVGHTMGNLMLHALDYQLCQQDED